MQQMDMVRSRDKGIVIPGWQRGRLRPFRGLLLITTERIDALNRYAKVARMHMLDRHDPAPPPLFDVQPVEMAVDFWTYSGFERIDDGIGIFYDFAQTWVLVPARETLEGYHGSQRV
jgi:hypothetical protein